MVGNRPQECIKCGATVLHGNMKRHLERRHRERPSEPKEDSSSEPSKALELCERLSDVLLGSGVPQDLWPADQKLLDRLQNYRLLEDRATAFDLPGEVKPRIIRDSGQDEALPSFEELIVRLACAVGAEKGSGHDVLGNSVVCGKVKCGFVATDSVGQGEFWVLEKHQSSPCAEDIIRWLSNLLEGHDDMRLAKILNLDAETVFPSSTLDRYAAAKDGLLRQLDIPSLWEKARIELNITPAFSSVHIHHDEATVLATVRTVNTRAGQGRDGRIAKIWIIWPPHHIHALSFRGSRTSYSDTIHSLTNAAGAMWFAQRDGETVVLPGDLAHATFTLESCYLIGSSHHELPPARASHMPADIAAGRTELAASMRLVRKVREALTMEFEQSCGFMLSFWSEGVHNIPLLRRNKKAWRMLVKTLREHLRKHGRCVSCAALGRDQGPSELQDALCHIKMHASNEISPRQKVLQGKTRVALTEKPNARSK